MPLILKWIATAKTRRATKEMIQLTRACVEQLQDRQPDLDVTPILKAL